MELDLDRLHFCIENEEHLVNTGARQTGLTTAMLVRLAQSLDWVSHKTFVVVVHNGARKRVLTDKLIEVYEALDFPIPSVELKRRQWYVQFGNNKIRFVVSSELNRDRAFIGIDIENFFIDNNVRIEKNTLLRLIERTLHGN